MEGRIMSIILEFIRQSIERIHRRIRRFITDPRTRQQMRETLQSFRYIWNNPDNNLGWEG